jgi:UDP-N-acetylmuramoylalanine--D-glutamate ligase
MALEKSTKDKVIKIFSGKRIAILGLGSENLALVEFLAKERIDCRLTLLDANPNAGEKLAVSLANAEFRLGKGYDRDLKGFDLISRVAGYPLCSASLESAGRKGAAITSPTKLFFELCPTENVIGVTGTKGKGTTSGLIYDILTTAGKRAFWGGNIGIPMFGFISNLKADDWVVLELSSFQLEDLEKSPRIAVITNLYPEHLAPADPSNPNYHKNLKEYWLAKLNIVKWQKPGAHAVLNMRLRQDLKKIGVAARDLGRGNKEYFSALDWPSRLPGGHNRENVAAAAAVAKIAGIKEAIAKKAVRKFKGLPHRLEFVGETGGVKYYDDSFATTPESSIIAMRSFDAPIVLLAGGADKGIDFAGLAKEAGHKAKHIILFEGSATPRLRLALLAADYPAGQFELADSMPKAFRAARRAAKPGDIVLLSTGCASFGIFKNYKERGDLFKREVEKLL